MCADILLIVGLYKGVTEFLCQAWSPNDGRIHYLHTYLGPKSSGFLSIKCKIIILFFPPPPLPPSQPTFFFSPSPPRLTSWKFFWKRCRSNNTSKQSNLTLNSKLRVINKQKKYKGWLKSGAMLLSILSLSCHRKSRELCLHYKSIERCAFSWGRGMGRGEIIA